jgi:hypothetical protein
LGGFFDLFFVVFWKVFEGSFFQLAPRILFSERGSGFLSYSILMRLPCRFVPRDLWRMRKQTARQILGYLKSPPSRPRLRRCRAWKHLTFPSNHPDVPAFPTKTAAISPI